MAPGLPDLDAVRAVCAALSRPFNFMAGIRGKSFSVAALAEAGVRRISLATSLYRAAMTGMLDGGPGGRGQRRFRMARHHHDHARAQHDAGPLNPPGLPSQPWRRNRSEKGPCR